MDIDQEISIDRERDRVEELEHEAVRMRTALRLILLLETDLYDARKIAAEALTQSMRIYK